MLLSRKAIKPGGENDVINLTSADSLAAGNRSSRRLSSVRAERAVEKANGIMSAIAEVKPFIKIMFSYYQIVGGMS